MGSKVYNIVSLCILIVLTCAGWVFAFTKSEAELTRKQVEVDNAQYQMLYRHDETLKKHEEYLIRNDKDHEKISKSISILDNKLDEVIIILNRKDK